MRQAIGGTWIFGLVAIFVIIFSSYLAISVNYSKAFKMKDMLVNIVEKYEGHNDLSKPLIEAYLSASGYNIRGNCGGRGDPYPPNTIGNSNSGMYCIKSEPVDDTTGIPKAHYYVTVFFRFDLPLLGNIFTFPVTGETKLVYYPTDK